MKNLTILLLCLLCIHCPGNSQSCTPLGDETTYGSNNIWTGYVYDNINLTAYSGYVNEGTIASANFDENFGGDNVTYPTNGCGVATSTFSIRYKLTKTFASGNYTFTVGGDDGYRLSLDGGATWVINRWTDQSYTVTTHLAALDGTYDLILEYYENGGGNRISFAVGPTCVGTENTSIYGTGNIWNGYIYDGMNFDIYSGMVNKGTAGSANFDENFGGNNVLYSTSSCTVLTETFSARYRLTKTFAAGDYLITVGGDDGYRLSIDGGATWLINNWSLHAYTTTATTLTLNGSYNLVLEYYENSGDNRVSFDVQLLTLLPVNLQWFTATPQQDGVQLNWTVTAGSTPRQFEVERSSNGIEYTTIATVPATAGLHYTVTDKNAAAGNWYYRLRMTDQNGQKSHSAVVTVRRAQDAQQALFYPTIVSGNTVTFTSGTSFTGAVVTLTDRNGRVTAQQHAGTITAGIPVQLQLTTNNHKPAAGLYFIKVHGTNGAMAAGKLVIQ
jgi:PA14 domain